MIKYLVYLLVAGVIFLDSIAFSQPLDVNHKLGPGLKEKIATKEISEQETLKISIWVKKADKNITDETYVRENISDILETEGASSVKLLKKGLREKNKEIVRYATESVIQYLKDENINVIYRSTHAPIIFVEITLSQLNSLLNRTASRKFSYLQ